MPVRLLLVDDEENFRSALRALIVSVSELEVVGEAADAESAFQLIEKLEPDLVLMDWRLEGMDGIEASRHILRAHPDIAVLMLSGSADARMRRAANAAGVAVVIDKGSELHRLLPEITAAMAKKRRARAARGGPSVRS